MISLRILSLVGFGGMIGAVCRYLLTVLIGRLAPLSFPLGTFIVNITGCFLLGVLSGVFSRSAALTDEMRLFLTVGVCGGFTTFSSFSYESLSMLQTGQYGAFIAYTAGSVVLGVAAVLGGVVIGR